ncbi:hypothetical protein FK85_23955 [Halorubrum saccharovorum]|uniref:Uncharacterized protein n=1 Tax=Halorubrum saccharovorum TaxID=2248 RepID=A0A0F8CM79_9EURY|nr:hypothetical protein FK85_23955 [Halorubrum saccharovorum]
MQASVGVAIKWGLPIQDISNCSLIHILRYLPTLLVSVGSRITFPLIGPYMDKNITFIKLIEMFLKNINLWGIHYIDNRSFNTILTENLMPIEETVNACLRGVEGGINVQSSVFG